MNPGWRSPPFAVVGIFSSNCDKFPHGEPCIFVRLAVFACLGDRIEMEMCISAPRRRKRGGVHSVTAQKHRIRPWVRGAAAFLALAFAFTFGAQSWITVKAKSILFTMLITFAMLLSLGVTVFGNAVVYALDYYFTLPDVFLQTWDRLKYTIPFGNLVLTLSVFYRYAAHRYRTKWSRAVSASVIVTAFWLLLTAGYSYYVLNISHMGLTYGSLIGLVVLFIWFHLAAMVIIMGGEFIATWKDFDRFMHPGGGKTPEK